MLRRGFNSPFWPYLLSTASIGQEGLDFHVWCDRVIHWDLPRDSFATILNAHGEDVKTVQELMRHANSSVTLNLYAQAVTDIKRTAQSKVARLVFSKKARSGTENPYWTFWTHGNLGDSR